MADQLRLTFRKGDLLAVACVLLLAAVLTVWVTGRALAARQVTVEVYRAGELVRSCPLEQEQSFDVAGDYTNTVVIRDGKVAIRSSDCPGADCVHSGWISQAGRAIVCLPNRTEVRLVGSSGGDSVDMVAG